MHVFSFRIVDQRVALLWFHLHVSDKSSVLDCMNKYSATYRFSRACMLSNSTGVDGSSQLQANFILPDINKLTLEAKSGSLAILLVSFGTL